MRPSGVCRGGTGEGRELKRARLVQRKDEEGKTEERVLLPPLFEGRGRLMGQRLRCAGGR